MMYACSPKQTQKLKNEHVLAWMKNENVPAAGVCIIENAKIKQVKVFGNLEYHTPAPLNTLECNEKFNKRRVCLNPYRQKPRSKYNNHPFT